ncbi:hypothetical protein [Sporosarcina sp. FSL K6-3457]|uniref:hypothetical protein n=1 Tax=Sporosarcina sp. FSL K6-3457 TaxID=2978204 RepID=UPI0030F7E8D0
MKAQVMSGQMVYKNLTAKFSDREYAIMKVNLWMHMLNDRMKPTKWLKPNKNGTKVNFDYIHSQEEYDQGLGELDVYLQEINRQFGFDFSINRDEK